MADVDPRFGANLRQARAAKGWSQENLAHEAGLNMTHVARIERAEREPGVMVIAKLANALDVRVGELFEGLV